MNKVALEELDENQLMKLYAQDHDIDVRNEIIRRNLYIAQIITKKFLNRGVEYEDLYQIASLALVKALERFDPSMGIKFASFATPSLMGEIKNYFRDNTRPIHIPRRDSEQLKLLNQTMADLSQKLGKNPSATEIAQEMHVDEERVLELLEAKAAVNISSLDAQINSEDDTELNVFIGKEEEGYFQIENRDFLKYCLSKLSSQEYQIIVDRYMNGKTQKQIAQQLGISQMQVSRIERKIISKFAKMYQN